MFLDGLGYEIGVEIFDLAKKGGGAAYFEDGVVVERVQTGAELLFGETPPGAVGAGHVLDDPLVVDFVDAGVEVAEVLVVGVGEEVAVLLAADREAAGGLVDVVEQDQVVLVGPLDDLQTQLVLGTDDHQELVGAHLDDHVVHDLIL